MEHTVSRRTLLASIAAGGAATAALAALPQAGAARADEPGSAATPSWLEAPAPIDDAQVARTEQADVVVVGGGMAGMCCAASAVEQGLSVAVVEKNERGRAFGLDFGCVNSTLATEQYGIDAYTEDDFYTMTRRWVAESSGQTRPDFVQLFLRSCGPAVDWICDKASAWGCTPVVAAYSSNSDTYRNALGTVEFHDGPAWDASAESFGARDVVDALVDECEKAGFPVAFNMAARQLVQDASGAVTGVICQDEAGDYVRYEAARGVVLATGDFAGDPDMLAHYSPWDVAGYPAASLMNYSTGTGDGHKMGLWAGGRMRANQPLMLLPFTYPYFYLHVNKNGERFMNEDSNSVGMSVAQLSQPEGVAWSIWDAKWKTEIPASLEFGGGMDWDQDFRVMGDAWDEAAEQATHDYNAEAGNLFVCDTLEELAEKCGLPYDAFSATVERYNALAEQGSDPDFGKRPELLTSISEPPFYALRMFTGLCVGVGGLDVDIDHAVLDRDGAPIPGLYALGNTATDLHTSGDYNEAVVPGNSLGRCVTFGKLLGEHLAAL